MKREQYVLLVALTVVAGLIGGAVSNWVLMAKSAVAEDAQKTDIIEARMVRASSFSLWDNSGNIRAEFSMTVDDTMPILTFVDKGLQQRLRLMITPDGRPSIGLYDENGTNRMTLGCTDLETIKTGSVEKRPESSLILFDKDGEVMQKLPGY